MASSVVHLQSVSPKIGCDILVVGDDAVDEAEELEVDDSGIEGESLIMKRRMRLLRR